MVLSYTVICLEANFLGQQAFHLDAVVWLLLDACVLQPAGLLPSRLTCCTAVAVGWQGKI